MKLIILAISLSFSFSSMAQTLDPIEVKGANPDGEECTYTIAKMDNWEGQIVMFLAGPNGNFRAEFNYEKLASEGELVPQYEGATMTPLANSGFKYTLPGEESADLDTVIVAYFNGSDLTQPVSIVASGLAETYICNF